MEEMEPRSTVDVELKEHAFILFFVSSEIVFILVVAVPLETTLQYEENHAETT